MQAKQPFLSGRSNTVAGLAKSSAAPALPGRPVWRSVSTHAAAGTSSGRSSWDIRMLYDGDCPLCMREVNMLKNRDAGTPPSAAATSTACHAARYSLRTCHVCEPAMACCASPGSQPHTSASAVPSSCTSQKLRPGLPVDGAGKNKIDFVDISSPTYSAADNAGISYEQAMGRIHAILPDGKIVTDVEVFRRLYEAVGLVRGLHRWPAACS